MQHAMRMVCTDGDDTMRQPIIASDIDPDIAPTEALRHETFSISTFATRSREAAIRRLPTHYDPPLTWTDAQVMASCESVGLCMITWTECNISKMRTNGQELCWLTELSLCDIAFCEGIAIFIQHRLSVTMTTSFERLQMISSTGRSAAFERRAAPTRPRCRQVDAQGSTDKIG